jgi:hypothetical protein
MSTASLSFTLRPATKWEDLLEAAQVRSLSYGRHLPNMRTSLLQPDDVDLSPLTTVFVCHDKTSGDPVGTARVQTSIRGPLLIDECPAVRREMGDDSRAEITRLAAAPGADALVKLALMKACYLYCVANQVHWLVIGARNEALIRQYGRLGFVDLDESRDMVPLSYTGGLLHRVMKFDVTAAEREWYANRHPLYKFMVQTVHKDIEIVPAIRIARSVPALVA